MNRKRIHIHFVCTGNAYRSRLAEAYLNSLKLPNIYASSSGLEASKHDNGPICWYAARIAYYEGIVKHLSRTKKDTKDHHLQKAHIVVFMHQDNFEMYRGNFTVKITKYEVWNIPDMHHLGFLRRPQNMDEEIAWIRATEETFAKIKNNVNNLLSQLQSA
jgi:protein-tyrosine-phosphatase